MKYKFLYIPFILTLFTLQGCDEMFPALNNSIDGIVLNEQKGPVSHATVSTSKYPVEQVDVFGNFHIENIIPPYNLLVNAYKYEEFYTKYYTCFYEGLTCSNPFAVIPLIDNQTTGYPKSILIKVHHPKIDSNKHACLFFLSCDNFQDNNSELGGGESDYSLYDIRIPADKSSITGYLCFLEYTSDINGITSYDKFGSLYINTNEGKEYVFTEEDLKLNPAERIMKIQTNFSQGYYNIKSVYLNFEQFSLSSALLISYYSTSSTEDYSVPLNLPFQFNIKVVSKVYTYSGQEMKIVYTKPEYNCVVNHSTGIELRNPENYYSAVDENTEFTFFSPHDGNSIYVIRINSYDGESLRNYFYYTKSTSVKFKNFLENGFTPAKSNIYYWNVERYADFKSLDDFVKSPYFENRDYIEKTTSNDRRFSIAE